MIISECNIKLFMACAYEKKDEAIELVGGKECWDLIYTQYVDLSGAADTKECTLLRTIHNIDCRLAFIGEMIELQITCFNEFQKPWPPATQELRAYGHRIVATENADEFMAQLKMIEAKENKRVAEKAGFVKELNQLRAEGMKASNIKEDDRINFIKLLNAISKHQGYGIDKEKTMIDEFGLMVKSHKEHYEILTQNN